MILFNVNINLNLVNIRKKILLSEILKLLSDNFTTWELNYNSLINKIIKFSSNFQLKLTYPINNNFRNTELNFIFKNKNIKKKT